jgi:hypothetical protein
MKKKIFLTILTMMIFLVSISLAFAGGNEREKMEKWAGVSRIDSFIGAKIVFDPKGNNTSYHGDIIVYPWMWANEEGANLLGVGYKGNYWESSSGHGQRHLGQLAYRSYRPWGNFRFSILGGVQNEKYGTSEPRYNLYGIGGFLSLNHRDSDGKNSFPKTELWAQALKAEGQNSKSTNDSIIDIGGRQYLHEGWFIKPYLEANLSIGTWDKYMSLGVGIGVTDKNEILFLSVGPQFDLKHGGVLTFVNAGLDTSNLVSTIIKNNAREQVKDAP